MVFSEVEWDRLSRPKTGIWDPRSAHPAGFPTGINASRVPRAVNTHALTIPLRHTAPGMKRSFPENIHFPEGECRGSQDDHATSLDDLHEVQEY